MNGHCTGNTMGAELLLKGKSTTPRVPETPSQLCWTLVRSTERGKHYCVMLYNNIICQFSYWKKIHNLNVVINSASINRVFYTYERLFYT